ncbi:MAG: bifunctional metallophosphatase/5'-nucleotidase [Verrucomicrobiae bacterium]|nr:bifunctional metallophosphatase/5'-nucleotidase [Verrucomicrobiae bacterium]
MVVRALGIFLATALALSAREVPLVILHTTDLHSAVLPAVPADDARLSGIQEATPDDGPLGGFARCATAIRAIRAKERNVLWLDNGDTIEGNALGFLTRGAAILRALNLLGCSIWTLGNHEFDWGLAALAPRLEDFKGDLLAANLRYDAPPGASPEIARAFARVKPFVIREMEGVKIGVLGLTTPGIPSWSRPRLIPGLVVEDSLVALRRAVPLAKAAGCDILLLSAHQGLRPRGDDHANQVAAIARNFPELDAIIGGHSHQPFEEQKVSGVLYTQANFWGSHLGRIDLTWDPDARRVTSRTARLLPMDATVPMNPEVLEALRPDLDRTAAALAERVGEATAPIEALGGPKASTPLHDLFCAAIAEAVEARGGKVDAVLHGLLAGHKTGLPAGTLRMADVWSVVPYENTVGVFEVSRDQLLEILEENASAYTSPRFRGLWGLTMKIKPSAPSGKRVVFLGDREGRTLPPAARLRLAANSYDLASGGRRWPRLRELAEAPSAKLVEYDFQTREALAEYLRKHSPIRPKKPAWWSIERAKPQRR